MHHKMQIDDEKGLDFCEIFRKSQRIPTTQYQKMKKNILLT